MNVRALLHSIEVAAGAIAAGAIGFGGLSGNMTKDVVAAAGLVVIIISTYLGSTTSGSTKAALVAVGPSNVA